MTKSFRIKILLEAVNIFAVSEVPIDKQSIFLNNNN